MFNTEGLTRTNSPFHFRSNDGPIPVGLAVYYSVVRVTITTTL